VRTGEPNFPHPSLAPSVVNPDAKGPLMRRVRGTIREITGWLEGSQHTVEPTIS
jgi:hypothetical protein